MALLCGIGQFTGAFGFATIPAVVCGHIARAQVSSSHGRQRGSGMAAAALVLGYAGLCVLAFYIWVLSLKMLLIGVTP